MDLMRTFSLRLRSQPSISVNEAEQEDSIAKTEWNTAPHKTLQAEMWVTSLTALSSLPPTHPPAPSSPHKHSSPTPFLTLTLFPSPHLYLHPVTLIHSIALSTPDIWTFSLALPASLSHFHLLPFIRLPKSRIPPNRSRLSYFRDVGQRQDLILGLLWPYFLSMHKSEYLVKYIVISDSMKVVL